MKNFESLTANLILNRLESIESLMRIKKRVNVSITSDIAEKATLLDFANQLFNLNTSDDWFEIKKELELIANPENYI